MAVTVDTFKARFPEFSTQDDARIQLFLDDGAAMCSSDFWATLYDLAVAYLAAHYLAIAVKSEADDGDPKAGDIIKERIDVLEVAYAEGAILASAENEYKGSSYGRRYLALLKSKSGISVV